jgi:2-aminoadipate transaminase
MRETIDRLHGEREPPKLFYTIPTFQNPTGRTTSEARRIEILGLAKEFDFLILEDDVYRDIAFEGTVPPSYFGLAGGKGIFRIGSFSKTLAPGLRLGWLIGHPEDIDICLGCGTSEMGGGANPFVSHIVAQYLASDTWDTHISRIRGIYQDRRDIALAALERFMPTGVQWTAPSGGIFLWITLPPSVSASVLESAAVKKKVVFSPGPGFFVDPKDGSHCLRLAYSFAERVDLEEGIRMLAETIEELA